MEVARLSSFTAEAPLPLRKIKKAGAIKITSQQTHHKTFWKEWKYKETGIKKNPHTHTQN